MTTEINNAADFRDSIRTQLADRSERAKMNSKICRYFQVTNQKNAALFLLALIKEKVSPLTADDFNGVLDETLDTVLQHFEIDMQKVAGGVCQDCQDEHQKKICVIMLVVNNEMSLDQLYGVHAAVEAQPPTDVPSAAAVLEALDVDSGPGFEPPSVDGSGGELPLPGGEGEISPKSGPRETMQLAVAPVVEELERALQDESEPEGDDESKPEGDGASEPEGDGESDEEPQTSTGLKPEDKVLEADASGGNATNPLRLSKDGKTVTSEDHLPSVMVSGTMEIDIGNLGLENGPEEVRPIGDMTSFSRPQVPSPHRPSSPPQPPPTKDITTQVTVKAVPERDDINWQRPTGCLPVIGLILVLLSLVVLVLGVWWFYSERKLTPDCRSYEYPAGISWGAPPLDEYRTCREKLPK